MSGRIILVVGLVLVFSPLSGAQDLKAKKLIAEVNDALYDAQLLVGQGRSKDARTLLQNILTKLEKDNTGKDHQALVSKVRERVEKLNTSLGQQQKENDKIIKETLAKREREREIQEKKQAKEISEFVRKFIGNTKDTVETHKRIKEMRERGVLDTLHGIDVTYAESFKENRVPERYLWALANRHTVKLAKEEVSILKALKTPHSLKWDKIPLKEAIEYLQEKAGLQIIVNENSLKEANLEYEDEKVSIKIANAPARSILRKILGERGLSYIIKNGIIHVVTAQQAKEEMTQRIYPVADLVSAPQFGFFGQQMAMQNATGLIQIIQSTIDPELWKSGTGASIMFDGQGNLVVRAPAEMHLMLGYGSKR